MLRWRGDAMPRLLLPDPAGRPTLDRGGVHPGLAARAVRAAWEGWWWFAWYVGLCTGCAIGLIVGVNL